MIRLLVEIILVWHIIGLWFAIAEVIKEDKSEFPMYANVIGVLVVSLIWPEQLRENIELWLRGRKK